MKRYILQWLGLPGFTQTRVRLSELEAAGHGTRIQARAADYIARGALRDINKLIDWVKQGAAFRDKQIAELKEQNRTLENQVRCLRDFTGVSRFDNTFRDFLAAAVDTNPSCATVMNIRPDSLVEKLDKLFAEVKWIKKEFSTIHSGIENLRREASVTGEHLGIELYVTDVVNVPSKLAARKVAKAK